MNTVELAIRLKRIRKDRGMTLEQVASRAGLSRGWLSRVENFRVTPSLQSISSIASALGVSLAELFGGLDDSPSLTIVPKAERVRVMRDEEISKLEYYSLAHTRPAREMDPFVLRVPKSDDRPSLSHAGQEFLYVLSGRVILEHSGRSHELEPGDSAYFDGSHPHRVVCEDNEPAEVLVVYYGRDTPSSEDGADDPA